LGLKLRRYQFVNKQFVNEPEINTMSTEITSTPRLKTLLEQSSKAAGSPAKLAPEIGYSAQELSMWKRGIRACPLEAQILMAAIAKRDIDEVIREALIERNAGTLRGEKLVSALGKGLMAIGAGLVFWLPGNDALAANLPGVLRCILC
jgi:hypothetical protein